MKRTGFSIYESNGRLRVYITRDNGKYYHRNYYPSVASTKRINAYCQAHKNKVEIEFYNNTELSLWIK